MSAMHTAQPTSDTSEVAFRGEPGRHWATVLATARSYISRINAYWIDVVRWPLYPLMLYATMRLTYSAAGRDTVAGANTSAFLLVGMFGLITWTATIWSSGYTLEFERSEGTIAALFLSPASRVAVILGYGLGGIVWLLPAVAVVTLLGLVIGARLDVSQPLAPLLAGLCLLVASVATGFALAGLFILSRHANLFANFIQLPAHFLAGFVVPRDSLPAWLVPLSDAIPASHALDALRASALGGATLAETLPKLGLTLGVSAVYALVGAISLRRIEDAAKRSGQLELY